MLSFFNDNGYKSRKFWFCIYAVGILLIGSILGAFFPAFSTTYTEFVGGVVAITTAYLAGNVAQKYVTGSTTKPTDPVDPVDPTTK
jgi:hypothetical protein